MLEHRILWELAKQHGAYECFHTNHPTGEDWERTIQRAVKFVGLMPKEDRYRPI